MSIGVGRNEDGRLEIFARGPDLAVWHNWQTVPNGDWSGWEPLGGGTHNDLAVGLNADGDLQFFLINDPGNCWSGLQSTGWTQGIDLGGHGAGGGLVGAPAVAANQDGRLELFARANDGDVWHNWQTAPSSQNWSGWFSTGAFLSLGVIEQA